MIKTELIRIGFVCPIFGSTSWTEFDNQICHGIGSPTACPADQGTLTAQTSEQVLLDKNMVSAKRLSVQVANDKNEVNDKNMLSDNRQGKKSECAY